MRIKTGKIRRRRHKKIKKMAKGYYGQKSSTFKKAHEAVLRSLQYAYRHRKNKKSLMRRLWIVRINSACREAGINYSTFMNGLRRAGVTLDRKALADLAVSSPGAFSKLVEVARTSLEK